jgi:hypothetical protein
MMHVMPRHRSPYNFKKRGFPTASTLSALVILPLPFVPTYSQIQEQGLSPLVAASSSLAWPIVPMSAHPICLLLHIPVYPYTLAASSTLAWPLVL